MSKWFYCTWYRKITNLELCKICYDFLRGECNPHDELMYYENS